jgi:hypothetical protein
MGRDASQRHSLNELSSTTLLGRAAVFIEAHVTLTELGAARDGAPVSV